MVCLSVLLRAATCAPLARGPRADATPIPGQANYRSRWSGGWPIIGGLHEGAPAGDRIVAVRDSNGNELISGDAVQVIKDLQVKGSADTLKRGTVFKNIRLTGDEESIECGTGRNTIVLKTCFLKKA
jgi:protein PhnA